MKEKDLKLKSFVESLKNVSSQLELMVNSPVIPYDSSAYGFLFTALCCCKDASRHICNIINSDN